MSLRKLGLLVGTGALLVHCSSETESTSKDSGRVNDASLPNNPSPSPSGSASTDASSSTVQDAGVTKLDNAIVPDKLEGLAIMNDTSGRERVTCT